jgi:type I restriction enzyme S subunit
MNIRKSLREVITFMGGGTPSKEVVQYWNGDIPWATVKDFTSTWLSATQDFITTEGLKNSSANLIPKGHVIIPTRMSLGKAAINTIDLAINQDLRALIPKVPLDSRYLLFAILSLKEEIIKKGSGATVKGITQEELYNLKIFFPPLDDQIRIAHLLDKVEALIAQCKAQLERLDELLKSVFLEMFGPANPNYIDWPLVEIQDLAAKHKGAMRTGPFGSNLLHEEFTQEGDVAVLGIDNIAQNYFSWDKRRFITYEKYRKLESYRVFPGDVVVTIMGTIGRSAVIPENIPLAINTKHLAAITLNYKLANPVFLSYSIHSSPYILNQFMNKNRGAIMNGLNLGIIKKIKIRRPPIEQQDYFASIWKGIDDVKACFQRDLADLETLYKALSQKAFSGELDLSRIPLPRIDIVAKTEGPKISLHGSAVVKVNTLPKPPAGTNLNDPEQRSRTIEAWLNAYLVQLSDDEIFSTQAFVEDANDLLTQQDNIPTLDSDDYDQLKGWVFEALTKGKLNQALDEKGNTIVLKRARKAKAR